MALKHFRRLITNTAFSAAVINTVQPGIQTNDKGYPAGEEFFTGLALRVYGALNIVTSSAGTATANAGFRFLRNVYFETDKHGPIINNVDGLSLARLQLFLTGTEPAVTDITVCTTGTPAFAATLNLPFAIPKNIRPEDSHLYMKTARGKLTWQGGVFTDFITGGTYGTGDIASAYLQQTSFVDAHADGSPLVAADMPLYVPFVELKKINITATESGKKIELPYGDRIYSLIAISQRNNSTLAEMNNLAILRTGNIRLEKNSAATVNTLQWGDIQDETKRMFGLETLPTGWGVINCAGTCAKPAQISEMLNTVDTAAGTLNLFADVVTGSNYDVWVLMFGYMPLRNKSAWADLPAEIRGA